MKVVECVSNISEGCMPEIYDTVAEAAARVPGVRLRDVDPGRETNRTVITLVGEPEAVLESEFELIKQSKEMMDDPDARRMLGQSEAALKLTWTEADQNEIEIRQRLE